MIVINGLSERLFDEVKLIKSRYPDLVDINDHSKKFSRRVTIHDGCPIIYKYYGLDDTFRFELGSHLSECFSSGDYISMEIA